mmetsp:Transcript_22668/g.51822  ORF Transcript_22668/g.51822 Transcript_22668/m.51822 type:complete len:306 (+) Transcript_22668:69-986(+)|eukprot:CAMPEP_0197915156 /NCGR_PEP_ID=MMETSP1439-20131203/79733_1 /TAXON_ID=66791 /ORGANISM="Gonyaulax spinifera, Strain CCMP409" /LENGTH=305 /DNA_ID=CAMNT_0043537099 /DNA_START=69 /DNA_END=986 /DNA_ORIENTATION=-
MGCIAAKHTKGGNAGTKGYSMQAFVSDHLTDVEGFICGLQNKSAFTTEQKRGLSKALGEYDLRAQVLRKEAIRMGKKARFKHRQPLHCMQPPGTICATRIVSAEVERDIGPVDMSGDFEVEVVFSAGFLFPPDAEWEQPGRSGEPLPLRATTEALVLNVQIYAILGAHSESGVGVREPHVICKHLVLPSELDRGGDSLMDSWFPIADALYCLETSLNVRLDTACNLEEARAKANLEDPKLAKAERVSQEYGHSGTSSEPKSTKSTKSTKCFSRFWYRKEKTTGFHVHDEQAHFWFKPGKTQENLR